MIQHTQIIKGAFAGFFGLVLVAGCTAEGNELPSFDAAQGAVDFASLEQAAHDTAECIGERGISVQKPEYNESAFAFEFSTSDLGTEVDSVISECIEEYYDPTSELWYAANASAIQEYNNDISDRVAECAKGRATGVGDSRIEEGVSVREHCLLEVLDEGGLNMQL